MDGDSPSVEELKQRLRDTEQLVQRQHDELIKKVTISLTLMAEIVDTHFAFASVNEIRRISPTKDARICQAK